MYYLNVVRQNLSVEDVSPSYPSSVVLLVEKPIEDVGSFGEDLVFGEFESFGFGVLLVFAVNYFPVKSVEGDSSVCSHRRTQTPNQTEQKDTLHPNRAHLLFFGQHAGEEASKRLRQ